MFLWHHHPCMPAPAKTIPFPSACLWVGRWWAWRLLGASSVPTAKPPWACLLLGHENLLAPGPAPLWASGSSVGRSQAHLLRQTASGLLYSAFCFISASTPETQGTGLFYPCHLQSSLGYLSHSPLPSDTAPFSGPSSQGSQKCPQSLLPQPPSTHGIFTSGTFSLTHHAFFQTHCTCLMFLATYLEGPIPKPRPGFHCVIPPLWPWTL